MHYQELVIDPLNRTLTTLHCDSFAFPCGFSITYFITMTNLKIRYHSSLLFIRELMQRRRRHRGRRIVKNKFIFYKPNSQVSRSIQYAKGSKIVLRLNMQPSIPVGNTKKQPSSFAFLRRGRTWTFHVLVLQRKTKKCTKIYNARAKLLFSSLNLLFGDVLVTVAVLVCLSSLLLISIRCLKCNLDACIKRLDISMRVYRQMRYFEHRITIP